MTKQKTRILLAVILVIAVGAAAFFAVQNTPAKKNARILSNLLQDFTDAISQEIIVETKGVYGKLNGNGNGIQYFGAALVKKTDIADLDALLKELNGIFETVSAAEQTGQKIDSSYLHHLSLSYETQVTDTIARHCRM